MSPSTGALQSVALQSLVCEASLRLTQESDWQVRAFALTCQSIHLSLSRSSVLSQRIFRNRHDVPWPVTNVVDALTLIDETERVTKL